MTGLIIIGTLLAAFALAAPRFGADTRTSDGWTGGRVPRAPPPGRHQGRADGATGPGPPGRRWGGRPLRRSVAHGPAAGREAWSGAPRRRRRCPRTRCRRP